MRIKKKTSMMLLAVSTAAVVGVAAVSFAAWQGGETLTANGETGTAYLEGFVTTEDLSFDAKLVPWDQKAETIQAGGATSVVSDAFEYLPANNYKITATMEATTENATYYVALVDSTATAAPAFNGVADENWTPVGTTAVELVPETPVETVGDTVSKKVCVAMVSEDSSTDMSTDGATKTFTLTLTYVAAE